MPGSTIGKCTITKVGKSDGKGTFARTRGNDKVAPTAAAPHDFSPTGKFDARGCGQMAAVSFAVVLGSYEQPQPEDALNDQDHQTDNHDLHRRGGSNGWITLPLDLREDVHRQAGLLRPRQEERQVDIGERDDER